MAEFKTKKDAEDYFDKKYAASLKTSLAKMTTVQAEYSKARTKFSVNAPAGLSEDQAQKFNAMKAALMKDLGYCDRYLASINTSVANLNKAFKTRGGM